MIVLESGSATASHHPSLYPRSLDTYGYGRRPCTSFSTHLPSGLSMYWFAYFTTKFSICQWIYCGYLPLYLGVICFSNRYPVDLNKYLCITFHLRTFGSMELVSYLCLPNQGHNDVFAMKIPGPICAQNGCHAPLIRPFTTAWIQDSSVPGENSSYCAGGQRLEKLQVQLYNDDSLLRALPANWALLQKKQHFQWIFPKEVRLMSPNNGNLFGLIHSEARSVKCQTRLNW